MTMKHTSDNLLDLGRFFHERRVGRGLTLQEVSGEWSAATLSRFERGELDISTQKMLELMTMIGIDELDLLEFYEANPVNFPLQLQDLTQLNDVGELERRKAGFFAAHPKRNSMTELARILFEAAQHWPDPEFRFSDEDEQILADRLAVPERFSLLELELYKAIVGPASHELLVLLWQRAQSLQKDWWQFREVIELMLWLGALMDRDMDLVNGLEDELKNWFMPQQGRTRLVEFMPNWQFGRSTAHWLRHPSASNKNKTQQIINELRRMDVEVDARWFELMLAHTSEGRVHHNLKLKDHPKQLTVAHTAGEVVKFQREYLGVSRADLVMDASVTSLRRFENGQTQLSASSMLQLCGELALVPSQILTLPNQIDEHTPGEISLRAVFRQIKQHKTFGKNEADILTLIQRFTTQFPDMPASLVATQRFVLKVTAGFASHTDEKMHKQASLILARLLQMNHWGSLETHASEELANWLTPDQLVMLYEQGRRVILNHPLTVGVDYYFSGLNQAIAQVVDHYSLTVGRSFVTQFKWVLTIPDATPMRWQAAGTWYLANYLLEPTITNKTLVERYVHASLRVGHPDAIDNLKKLWVKRLPEDFINNFVLNYK